MIRLYSTDDFEAVIRILPLGMGGRETAPFNGIRWDICYAVDKAEDGLWAIHPDFLDQSQNSLPKDKPLPIDTEIPARMVIMNDELRQKVHRSKIAVGEEFYCHEGSKRVAVGRITKITGLFKART
jgi:hypothetical protein